MLRSGLDSDDAPGPLPGPAAEAAGRLGDASPYSCVAAAHDGPLAAAATSARAIEGPSHSGQHLKPAWTGPARAGQGVQEP